MSRQTFVMDNTEFVFGHDHATGWFYQIYIDDECVTNKSESFDGIDLYEIKAEAALYGVEISEEMISKHLKETPRERYLNYKNPWLDLLLA